MIHETTAEIGYFKHLSITIRKMQDAHGKLNVILAWQKLHSKTRNNFHHQIVDKFGRNY